ncbi:FAD-dependent oxidoreductase [Actinomycetospora sp. TBRC 11914]|uniref:NAD(P)/FAD-dependent oxidoreductase n=1 Tax=Actinomycetospora sp. TBRC 11914 TaxID=2729387 RepID=UPI00145CC1A8|nr:FAD-dependent oxidoreductase [Actinomycetospora sp. TBRC 11914]NMO89135.1 FAD-dependent oxidoreductase [Actinomycetospora sp. TBRC 11914]
MPDRVVVVGGGFAGLGVARRLERRMPDADVRLVCPEDYMLYLPLLPQVAAGVLPPAAVTASLARRLRRTTFVPGRVVGVDLDRRCVVSTSITGRREILGYDRLVLAPGSITRTMDIPGLRDYGRGMKTLAEAQFLRDHVLGELEVANVSDDPEERARRLRFVVVGGGYAGVETTANLQLMTSGLTRHFRRLDPAQVQWHLVQHGAQLMPELGPRLGEDTLRVLRHRGVHVDLRTSLTSADDCSVTLSDGRRLETNTLVWTAGVAPNPLVSRLGADTEKGRLVVGADLAVPGHPEVFALGDCAAVPDLAAGDGAVCPPTAQHATRQAPVAADNVVASLRGRPLRRYRHRDLGLVVDLGGPDAVAKPLHVDLSGRPAQVVTRGYHLAAMGAPVAMARVAGNWALHAATGNSSVRLGFLTRSSGRLAEFEHTDDYLTPEQARRAVEQGGDPVPGATAGVPTPGPAGRAR